MQVVIPSVPRTENFQDPSVYKYLRETLTSIFTEANFEFFTPCVVVYNLRGTEASVAMHTQLQDLLQLHGSAIAIVDLDTSTYHKNIFEAAKDLPDKKKKQSMDMYTVLKHFSEHATWLRGDAPYYMLMEDDFIMCKDSFSHLMRIFHHQKQLQQQQDWVGYRISYGLNGLILQYHDIAEMVEFLYRHRDSMYPIDHLIEHFLAGLWEDSMLYLNGRQFFIYKYQLMDHIGQVSTVGNNDDRTEIFPKCFELQYKSGVFVEFNMYTCSHALFTPCQTGPADATYEDVNLEIVKSATSEHSLHELQKLTIVTTKEQENCNLRCQRMQPPLECKVQYFQYINHCKELSNHFACENGCIPDEVFKGSMSPKYNRHNKVCKVAFRRSKFNCFYGGLEGDMRICPCGPKHI